jgi:hypothetical protein
VNCPNCGAGLVLSLQEVPLAPGQTTLEASTPPPPPQEPRYVPNGEPACRIHGPGKVKAGRNGGYFCATKLPDGSWCDERPR